MKFDLEFYHMVAFSLSALTENLSEIKFESSAQQLICEIVKNFLYVDCENFEPSIQNEGMTYDITRYAIKSLGNLANLEKGASLLFMHEEWCLNNQYQSK